MFFLVITNFIINLEQFGPIDLHTTGLSKLFTYTPKSFDAGLSTMPMPLYTYNLHELEKTNENLTKKNARLYS